MSQIGSKIDFKGDPNFESAAWFFVNILKFIFEIKIKKKEFLDTKKKKLIFESRFLIWLRKVIFYFTVIFLFQ